MSVNARIQLRLHPCIIQAYRLLGLVKVFYACLGVLLVFDFKLLGQLQIDFNHLFFVDGLLLDIQVVHNKEVLSATWLKVNSINLLI